MGHPSRVPAAAERVVEEAWAGEEVTVWHHRRTVFEVEFLDERSALGPDGAEVVVELDKVRRHPPTWVSGGSTAWSEGSQASCCSSLSRKAGHLLRAGRVPGCREVARIPPSPTPPRWRRARRAAMDPSRRPEVESGPRRQGRIAFAHPGRVTLANRAGGVSGRLGSTGPAGLGEARVGGGGGGGGCHLTTTGAGSCPAQQRSPASNPNVTSSPHPSCGPSSAPNPLSGR